jgi:hydrogenase maturation factor
MSKHAAVYSVVGANGKVNFVGVSRNVALSLACHAKNEGPSMVSADCLYTSTSI